MSAGENPAVSFDDDPLALLERALDQTDTVLARIRPVQASLPTPCPDWDVRALIRHLVGQDLPNFTTAAQGGTPDWQAPAEEVGEEGIGVYRARARRLLDVWHAARLDQPVSMPSGGEAPLGSRVDQQLAELAVHTWDLAKASGQDVALDPAVAGRALEWSSKMLRPEFRGAGKPFGDEVPVDPQAPISDRLVGWFGRDPGWTPPG
jgi:uncharacterized protein (TIGR03086 family)